MQHIMEKSQSSICQDEVPCFLDGNSKISFDTSSVFSCVISWVAFAKDQSMSYLAVVNMKKGDWL